MEETGWRTDATAVVERIRRLHLGMPVEDEFSVLLGWLGKCNLVHKLDQMQAPPESGDFYQIPDLLTVFQHEGREIPVLIEVKSKATRKLSWKASYYRKLEEYGRTLGLPVLVAWKRNQFWALFELKHFELAKTNYKISFETAQKQNLLGVLAGDFIIVLHSGVGFYLTARKEKLLSSEQEEQSRESWQMRIEEAHFTNADGVHLNKIGSGLWTLLFTSDVEEVSNVTDSTVSYSLQVPAEQPLHWAHEVLANLLELRAEENYINWREILLKYDMPMKAVVLREDVQKGIETRIVRYVGDQVPQEQPHFLTTQTNSS